MAIVWRGDDSSEAAELRIALEGFVERSLEGTDAGDGAFELDGGWAAVDGERDVATLAVAPDQDLARRLAAPVAQPVK